MGRAAIIAVAVTAAAGGAALVVTPSGGSPMANLWVDTNGGTCTDVAGAGGVYVDANACSSFDAANDTCEDGDVVRVKNGAYSGQGITGSNGRATPCSMIGESEAGVTMPTLTVQTAAAELDLADMTVTSTATGGGQLVYLQQATDISFDNFTIDHQWTTGANFKLGGDADGVTVTNSTICCVHNYPMLEIVNLGSGRNEDIVFEDTNIYGLSRDDFGDVHNEMFLIWGSPVTAGSTTRTGSTGTSSCATPSGRRRRSTTAPTSPSRTARPCSRGARAGLTGLGGCGSTTCSRAAGSGARRSAG
jgi:hypothetical protein